MSDQQTRGRGNTILFYGSVLLLAYFLYLLFEPFLRPLAWAAIFSVYFHPQYRRLASRFGRTGAAAISTTMVTMIIVVPSVLVLIAFIQQATQTIRTVDFSSGSPGILRLQHAWAWVQHRPFGSSLGSFDDVVRQTTSWLTTAVAHRAGGVVVDVATMIVNLIVSLFALFFFFRDGDTIIGWIRRVAPFHSSFSDHQIAETGQVIRASISAGFIVALVQGALGGITFALLGLGAPIFWGVMMGFFALLPLGTGVVWVPVAGWLLLTGQYAHGIVLIAVGAGIIGLVDNFLRPMLLSGRTQMNGMLVFVSLLGGIATFGLLGLVLGPVIMATATSFISAYAAERTVSDLDETR